MSNKFLQSVFSVTITENREHLLIKILGVKFKINRLKNISIADQKIVNNKIVFSNYIGNSYGCNPKYITEEILKQRLPYELVWLVKDSKKMKSDFPKEVRLVDYFSKDGIKELLSAGIWVDNMRKRFFWEKGFKKKDGQFYIQTWHGSLGIKKMEGDIDNEDTEWRKLAKTDSQNIDLILSNSKFLDDLYKRESCFWYKGKVERTGHPRNDIFFKSEEEKNQIIKKVYSTLKIPDNAKTVLYVPTFRDDGDTSCLNIDFEKLKNALENKFNCKYQILMRLHPLVPSKEKSKIIKKDIIDAGIYPDIQELLLASDIVISDYSSCMFDFILTRKPVFIYASDIKKYNTERGFYYPLETTPFPIAKNNEELIENIKHFNYDKFRERVEEFLDKVECADTGTASEKVVNIIKEIIKQPLNEYEQCNG